MQSIARALPLIFFICLSAALAAGWFYQAYQQPAEVASTNSIDPTGKFLSNCVESAYTFEMLETLLAKVAERASHKMRAIEIAENLKLISQSEKTPLAEQQYAELREIYYMMQTYILRDDDELLGGFEELVVCASAHFGLIPSKPS